MTDTTPPYNPPASPVPMFGPDGVLRDVPYDKLHDAMANGMKPGVRVKFPDDSDQVRYVPPDKFMEATHEHGAKVLPIEEQSTDHPSVWSQIGNVVHQMLEAEPIKWAPGGAKEMLTNLPQTEGPKIPTPEEDAARQAKGYGSAYRKLVPAAELAGVDVPGMEQAADTGDVAGVQARAAVPAAIALAHPTAKLVGKAGVALGLDTSTAAGVVKTAIHPKAAILRATVNALSKIAEERKAAEVPTASTPAPEATAKPAFQSQRKLFGGQTVPPLPDEELARMDAARAAGRARAASVTPPAEVQSQPAESAPGAPEDAKAPAESTSETPAVEKKPLPVRDVKTGRMISQSSDLLKKASGLRQPVRDLVDSVVDTGTSKNLQTKSAVEFYLNKGDVVKAQAALDAVKPDPTAETPYPSDEPIKAPQEKGLARDPVTGRVLNKADSEKFRKIQDKLEDKGIVQDLDEGLTKEGRRAYRQFLKDNSPMTKAELTDQPDQMPGWGRENAIPKAKPDTKFAGKNAGPQAINDLTEILERSRKQAELMKQAGASRGAIQEMQAKKVPVGGGSQISDAEALRAASEKQFNEDMKKPNVEPFFSKAAWVTDEKIPNAISGDAALSTLRNAGVKEGEIKWMGLDDYLKGKAKVSRADIQGYIKEHEIKLGEKNFGEHPEFRLYQNLEETQHAGESVYDVVDPRNGLTRFTGNMDAAREYQNEMRANSPIRYEQYTLPGEKSNYTEKLLTLPEHPKAAEFRELQAQREDYLSKKTLQDVDNIKRWRSQGWSSDEIDSKLSDRGTAKFPLEEEYQEAQAEMLKHSKDQFKSGHFDEPNILAHVRYDDRVDAAGKKTLFLEEVQSDWHQKGKREGYQGGNVGDKITVMRHGSPVEVTIGDKPGPTQEAGNIWVKPTEGQGWFIQKSDLKGVPDAPFKTDWHELVMKRMLREAAEKGYDKLAWTTGEQQAERYDLSKQIKTLEYYTDDSRLVAYDHHGASAINKSGVTPEQLTDYVGKDAAKKLLDSPINSELAIGPFHRLEGADLKVGGEWAKRLYDQAIPNFLNKYAKKWGAKVSTTILENNRDIYGEEPNEPLPTENKVHFIDITPEMKRDVLKKGQPIAAKEEPKELVNA